MTDYLPHPKRRYIKGNTAVIALSVVPCTHRLDSRGSFYGHARQGPFASLGPDFTRDHGGRVSPSALWIGATLSLTLASSWLVFSAIYYGDIFPTSYYIKFADRGRAPIDSISVLLKFVLLSGLFLIVLLV